MSKIVIDAAALNKLVATGEVQVTDDAGNPVGLMLKRTDWRELVADGDWPTDEELDRIERESPRYTTRQVIDYLKGLSK